MATGPAAPMRRIKPGEGVGRVFWADVLSMMGDKQRERGSAK